VYRLLQAIPTETFLVGLEKLRAASLAGAVTEDAIDFLHQLFGSPDSPGSLMAARALDPFEDPLSVGASCSALATDLLTGME
jgi:hypothetical protein